MCTHLPLSTCSLLCAKFNEKTEIGCLIDGFVYLFIYSSFQPTTYSHLYIKNQANSSVTCDTDVREELSVCMTLTFIYVLIIYILGG